MNSNQVTQDQLRGLAAWWRQCSGTESFKPGLNWCAAQLELALDGKLPTVLASHRTAGSDEDQPPCPDCDHEPDDHDTQGCRGYTPSWPRLVRCDCTQTKESVMATLHQQMQSNECVCGHPQGDHLYGDYYDAGDVKRKHQGECGLCGCQGYC